MKYFGPRIAPRGHPAWIEVSGFKSLREPTRIQIRPLTLLAGENSSGKSSMLQPLLLLKQSLEVPYEPDPLLLDGPHVSFTSLDQFMSRAQAKKTASKKLTITFGAFSQISKRLMSNMGRVVTPEAIDVKYVFKRGNDNRFSSFEVHARRSEQSEWIHVHENNPEACLRLLDETMKKEFEGKRIQARLFQRQIHTEVSFFSDEAENSPKSRPVHRMWLEIDSSLDWLLSTLHLPGLRGHRDRRYPMTKVSRSGKAIRVVGPVTPYSASLLHNWEETKVKKISDALRTLGLSWKVQAKAMNASELELRVGRMPEPKRGGAQDLVDIADVGFGMSQVLPVLIALTAAVKNQLVLIEQPELHLHPRAQLAMGQILADAAKRGVIVVVETHSPLILRSIQTIVAQGKLNPDSVGLHWFTRDRKTGFSKVKLAELKRNGSFGDWPVDFADVEMKADQAYLDSVFKDFS